MLFTKAFDVFRHTDTTDLDNPDTTLRHRQVILGKPFLKAIYDKWYNEIIRIINQTPERGIVLEIGSGGGFFKDVYPAAVTSDILPLDCCDITLDAQSMPYAENTIRAITMVNVFHHIPNCSAFLAEAQRTLKMGGKIIMIEPGNSFWSRSIYQKLHHEPFLPEATHWKFTSTGPLSCSNQALPYIVFERDRKEFERLYPSLKIESVRYHTPTSYLLSGGVSRRSLIPTRLGKSVLSLEDGISSRRFNMFWTIIITKV